ALDRASVGGDARDPSVAPLETGHADTEHEPRAAVLGALRERERGVAGVDGRVVREDRRADQVLDLGFRPVLPDLLRRYLVGLDPEVLRHRETGAELLHPASRPRDGQRSHPAETGLD